MSAIRIADLDDAKVNVDYIKTAATSPAKTAVDPLGVTRKTLAGAIDSIAATNPRGAWSATPTPAIYARKDLVVVGSVVYMSTVDHTPSGSFATDLAAGNWAVHKGVTAEDLALSTAAAGLGWVQAGAGAVAWFVQDKLRERKSVLDYMTPEERADVLLTTPLLDHSAAVLRAVTAYRSIDFGGAEYSYNLLSAVALPIRTKLSARGAKVYQGTNNVEIFNIEGKSDIEIVGFEFIGRGDYSGSDSSRACAIYGGTSGARIRVMGNKFVNFGYTPARFKAQSQIKFLFNEVIGPTTLTPITDGANYGVLFDAGCSDFLAFGNSISRGGQGVMVQGATNGRIAYNYIFDIDGQHGIYTGGGVKNLTITVNTINSTALIGIKVQADNESADCENITVTINVLSDTGSHSILLSNGAGSTLQAVRVKNAVVSCNAVMRAGGAAVNIQNTDDSTIAGNVVDVCDNGLFMSASNNCTYIDNKITRSRLSAVSDAAPCPGTILRATSIRNPATDATPGDRFGVLVGNCTGWTIEDSDIDDSDSKMEFGLNVDGGTQSTLRVRRNIVRRATNYGARFAAAAACREFRQNSFTGSGVGNEILNQPVAPTVASATQPSFAQDQDVFFVSGTTNIAAISSGGHSGHTIKLIFQAVLTVVDGNNLKLAGNFVTAADSVLVLTCPDGLNWYEVSSRSTN